MNVVRQESGVVIDECPICHSEFLGYGAPVRQVSGVTCFPKDVLGNINVFLGERRSELLLEPVREGLPNWLESSGQGCLLRLARLEDKSGHLPVSAIMYMTAF
jgi:hypothetical protein